MTHLEIVEKLIGEIRPVGETNVDNERFENLKRMCELCNEIISKIDSVGYDFKDYQQYSMQRASSYAQQFLTVTVGIQN